jgi:hypothetical protein
MAHAVIVPGFSGAEETVPWAAGVGRESDGLVRIGDDVMTLWDTSGDQPATGKQGFERGCCWHRAGGRSMITRRSKQPTEKRNETSISDSLAITERPAWRTRASRSASGVQEERFRR